MRTKNVCRTLLLNLSLPFKTTFILLIGAGGLLADPEILRVSEPDLSIDGETAYLNLEIVYNNDVDGTTIDSGDLNIEGTSGPAKGNIIPLQGAEGYNSSETEITAFYYAEPFEISNMGEYSIKIAEGQVLGIGEPPLAVPAGEIATFKVPPDLEILRVNTPIVTIKEDGAYFSLEVVFNRVVEGNSIDINDLSIEGISGSADGNTVLLSNATYFGSDTELSALYDAGPFDASLLGQYSVNIAEDQVYSTWGSLITVPAGEIATFKVPPDPAILSVSDPNLEEYVETAYFSVEIVYNNAVDPATIDMNDITIEGISGPATGNIIPVSFVDLYPPSDIGFTALYEAGPFDSSIRGEYSVTIVENQVKGIYDPPVAIPAGVISTFLVATDSIRVIVQGRTFVEEGEGEPSLEDDGWQVDPGIDLVPHLEKFSSGQWEFYAEYFPDHFYEDENLGRYELIITSPGEYRLLNQVPINEDPWVAPPWPEWVIQAVGDPSRDDAPKDHAMHFTITEDMDGQTLTYNFSYFEEHDSPEAIEDDAEDDPLFQVLTGSKKAILDVLKNDTVNDQPAQPGELTIIGLAPGFGPSTDTTSEGSQTFSVIETDGDYIYYTPSFGYQWETFTYTIEDGDGNRDFADVFVQVVSSIETRFAANDDFATAPVTADRVKINVLANDTTQGGISKDQLVITDITTPTAGGRVSFQGSDVTYWPPKDFLGIDTFDYTMTDHYSGTDTATVSVSVNKLPHSLQREALLRLLLQLFGSRQGGGDIFAFFKNHISEINYLILDQDGGSVAPKVDKSFSGDLPLSRLQVAGTSETEAGLSALLDMAQPGFVAVLGGQGDSVTVSQELVNELMNGITYVEERASPDLKADLQALCEEYNDFQGLVGKTFDESASILGVSPDSISIPNLALERINNVLSITTWDAVGLAFKLWKSNNLQPDSWQEVENAEIEKEGLKAKISDPDIGNQDVFYRVTSEIEQP